MKSFDPNHNLSNLFFRHFMIHSDFWYLCWWALHQETVSDRHSTGSWGWVVLCTQDFPVQLRQAPDIYSTQMKQHSQSIIFLCDIFLLNVKCKNIAVDASLTYLESRLNRAGTRHWALLSFFLCCSSSKIRVTLGQETTFSSGTTLDDSCVFLRIKLAI